MADITKNVREDLIKKIVEDINSRHPSYRYLLRRDCGHTSVYHRGNRIINCYR